MNAEDWLSKAKRDYSQANIVYDAEQYDLASFLLHQATEKCLKPVLIHRKEGLIKTHDCYT